MTKGELATLSVAELQGLLRRREVSPPEVLQALEEQIRGLDGEIGAYLARDLARAMAEAARADVTLPLGGVPVGIKDIISVEGEQCSCASKMLRGYRAMYNATVVERLRAHGAIPFGRLNLDEFAMGSSTENSSVQLTRNPWDTSRVPGGSSGGPAAAVAAHEAFAALGTDTGGSVRQPASFCGVVGVKPTYGRVSRFGLVAFASSLDQIGPLTRTVRDSALMMNAIAGHDARDSTSVTAPVPDHTRQLGHPLKGLRLGFAREYMVGGIDAAVKEAVETAFRQLQSLGAELSEVSLPHTEHAISVYYIIATAEASANLARFDGVRYGHRAANAANITELYRRSRAEGFGPEVKRRIILGTYVLSSGYYEAYYLRAQKVRELIRRDFAEAFEKVDAIVSPTCPTVAFKFGEKTADPLQMYLADVFTTAANLAGICGISLPCGFATSAEGKRLPVGLQLLSKPLHEPTMFQIAYAFEQSTEWHKVRPSLSRRVTS